MKKFNTLSTITLAFGLLLGGISPAALAGGSGHEASQAAEQSQSFTIEKMTCAACPITIKKAMQRVDGVKTVKIDFDSKTAVAVFDPSVTNASEIAAASSDVGYPASIVE